MEIQLKLSNNYLQDDFQPVYLSTKLFSMRGGYMSRGQWRLKQFIKIDIAALCVSLFIF